MSKFKKEVMEHLGKYFSVKLRNVSNTHPNFGLKRFAFDDSNTNEHW